MTKYEVATPHLIKGMNILKNKPGFTDQKQLDIFEEKAFVFRCMDVPEGNFSTNHLRNLHKHLLQDVYEWAGEFRDVPIAKGRSRFCQPQFIDQQVDKITLLVDVEKMKKAKAKDFASKLAEIVGELNAVHPFLDGNGRAIRVYAQQVAAAAGYDLEIYKLKGEAWNKASEQSFMMADNCLLAKQLSKALTHERDRGLGR